MQQETKMCPYCGGEISINAKKCKHCGEWFEYKKSNLFIDFFAKDKFLDEKKITSIIFTIIFIILTIIFVISAFVDNNEIKSCFWAILSILCTLWCIICLRIIDKGNDNEK